VGCLTEDIEAQLAKFPDPDPRRPFPPDLCFRADLRGPGRRIEIPREIGKRKPFFRRTSFWDVLMGRRHFERTALRRLLVSGAGRCYSAAISLPALERLRANAGLVKYSTVEQQIRRVNLESVDLFVTRE
jgi:hypothetical protein